MKFKVFHYAVMNYIRRFMGLSNYLMDCLITYNASLFNNVQEVGRKWHEMQELIPQRDSALENEVYRQQNNERLRRQFAQKANTVGQWIERHLDLVESVGTQKGSLDDHLNKLKGL